MIDNALFMVIGIGVMVVMFILGVALHKTVTDIHYTEMQIELQLREIHAQMNNIVRGLQAAPTLTEPPSVLGGKGCSDE